MNVAYLCFDSGIPILGDKGASVHVREFTRALTQRNHRVTLICAKLGAGNPLGSDAVALEVAPDALPQQLRERDAAFWPELSKIAYNEDLPERTHAALTAAGMRPEALYERNALFCDAGDAIARRIGVPRILEVNAPLVHEQSTHRGLRLRHLAAEMEARAYQGADHVIAVSSEIAAHVERQGVAAQRITVLPNGVDVERFSPAVDGSRRRKEVHAAGRPVIGFIGSLKPWHGVNRLIDLFAEGALRPHDPLLVIVGTGPEYEPIRDRIDREGLQSHVVLTGRVPHEQIPEYLAAMDLTCAPYDANGDFYFSPMKIVESLAAGRPVVAPNIGQIPSLISDMRTGVLYDAARPGALADGIAFLLAHDELRRRMGVRAARLIRSRHTWSANASRVETIFYDLIARQVTHHAS